MTTARSKARGGRPRTHRVLLGLAGLLLAWAGTSGCGVVGPRVCTEMGCSSGLVVDLQGASDVPFTLTASVAGRAPETLECQSPDACLLLFEDLTAAEVTLTYTSGGVTVQRTFTPEYERIRPNGEDCPPECVSATVVFDVNG